MSSKERKNPLLIKFAKRVRMSRHELELTQEELAEKAGLHTTYIGGIERAERNPTFLSIIALAKALKISPQSFFPEN